MSTDDQPFELVPMDPAEEAAMQAEINAVLAKYGAEIGVRSTIQSWKRKYKGVPSPLGPDELKPNGGDTTKT